MKEIKFACPQCGQHIACDGGYGDLGIECPACGTALVVPRMDPKESSKTGMVIVASTGHPPRPVPLPPLLDPWTEDRWERHSRASEFNSLRKSPFWAITLCATLLVAFLLNQSRIGLGPILICGVVGSLITLFLALQARGEDRLYSILSILGMVFAAALGTAGLVVGILFIGCSACPG